MVAVRRSGVSNGLRPTRAGSKEACNKLNVSSVRVAKWKFKESAPGKGERDRIRVAKGKFKESGLGKRKRDRIRIAKGKFKESGPGKRERDRARVQLYA